MENSCSEKFYKRNKGVPMMEVFFRKVTASKFSNKVLHHRFSSLNFEKLFKKLSGECICFYYACSRAGTVNLKYTLNIKYQKINICLTELMNLVIVIGLDVFQKMSMLKCSVNKVTVKTTATLL